MSQVVMTSALRQGKKATLTIRAWLKHGQQAGCATPVCGCVALLACEQGAWAIATLPVNWFGDTRPQGIFVYGQGQGRPAVIYDGTGNVVETLPMVYAAEAGEAERKSDSYGLVADVWGDAREEVILFNSQGACIYANARPNELPSLYNETLYPGM